MASDYERLLDSQKLQGNVAKLLGVEDEKNLANDVARNWARENRLEDNAEDTLRHILLGGLLQNVPKTQGLYGEHGEDILGRMGKGIARQFIDRGPFGLGREGTDKESLIDIANNNFGGELRVQYPSTESFIRAAKEAVSDLIKNKKVKGIKGISPRLSTVGGQKNKFQEGGNVMAEDKNTQGALAGIAEENEENLAWLKRVNDKSILNEIYDVVVKKFKELGGSQEQPTYGPITYTPVQPETATPTSVSTRDFATESPQPVRSGIVDTSLRGPVKEPETLGPPKRGFVSPTVSSVQTTPYYQDVPPSVQTTVPYYQDVPPSVQTTEHTGGDARLAESLYQSPKPRKPDRGPYEMGTKDYGRRKSLRNQTPEQKIANEVDQLRSANLISDTSQDMSGVASAIKTAMSQHEVNPDFTNSDTARAYQILQELPTNVQTGPATLSSLIENPTDEENRNFMKKHAPVLYQAFPALRAIYDRDIQSATPANIQDLADVVGLDNLPPAMQERILTKREAIEYEVTPQAKEKKWVDDFHDTEGLAARGGLIGYQMGAEVQTNPMRMGSEDTGSAGFIGTTKEGREDRAMALQNGDMGTDGVDATVDEGSFVLNSWAVALAGRQYIEELVKKAKQYIASPEGRAQLGNRELQPEEIDIRVSNGEYVFPPAMVEIIGRERLEKMNNRGIQAFEEEQRGRSQEVAMTMQGPEGLVPRPDQIPQNPAQEGGLPQQQIGAHRGGTIGGTKGIIRELEELFYGFEPEPEPKSMLLVMGEKDEKNESPSKQLGGFVSNNGSKKNYARGDLVSISPPIPEMKPTKDNSFVHRSGSIPLHSEVSGKSKVLKRREPREAHIEQVAKIIYGEGRGEKEEGMKAIAHVIRNRLNRDKKRSTKEFTNGYFYQSVVAKPLAFSVTNPNLEKGTKEYANQQNMEEAYKNYKDPSKKSDEEFLRAIQIARDLFQNNLGKDITKGAVMYHSATMKQQDVNWNFKQLYETIRIGDHIFYNYRDSRPEMKPQKFDDGGFVKELLKKYDKRSKITEPVLGLIQSGKKLKDIYDKSGFEISIKNKGKISKKGNISDILPVNTKGQYNLEVDPIRKDAYVKFTIPFST